MRRISRSSEEARQRCARKYYYNYEYKLPGLPESATRGLDTRVQSLYLVIGNGTHKGLETAMRVLCETDDITLVDRFGCGKAAQREFNILTVPHRTAWEEDMKKLAELDENEQLCFALTYGWLVSNLDAFHRRFKVLQVEEEIPTPLSPNVELQSRLDVLVEERATSDVYVINWKTSSKKDPLKLLDEYKNNSQMWSEPLAAEQHLGRPVVGTIPICLYKGTLRYGQHATPLLYSYQKDGVITSKYTRGWLKLRGDQLEMGLRGWIDQLPAETVAEQFITLDPIVKNNSLVEDRLEGWVYREERDAYVLEHASEGEKLLHFGPQDGRDCEYCPFKKACRLEGSIDEMVASGELVNRVDHHTVKEETKGGQNA